MGIHAAIGCEIIHQHPSADGAAIGACSLRDFRRLAEWLPAIHQGGAVVNLGSAVVMPEVFLKALSMARNLHEGNPGVPGGGFRHDSSLPSLDERGPAPDPDRRR